MKIEISYTELETLNEALSQYVENAEEDENGNPILAPHVEGLLDRMGEEMLDCCAAVVED